MYVGVSWSDEDASMKRRVFLAAIAFVLSICVGGSQVLSAQGAPAGGIPVHTIVTVESHHGSNPPVIQREDVMVYEGKDRDTVTEWVPAQGDRAGLELFILLDDGSNVSLGTQLEDIRQFINSQPASTRIGVAYMQNGTARIEQNLTSDHALAAKALRLPLGSRGVNASPYFSVSDLVKRWPASTARREIFMASDGVDLYYGAGDSQDPYLQDAIEDAQRAGILVSAVYTPSVGHIGHSYWLTYWGQLYLSELAEKTGGAFALECDQSRRIATRLSPGNLSDGGKPQRQGGVVGAPARARYHSARKVPCAPAPRSYRQIGSL